MLKHTKDQLESIHKNKLQELVKYAGDPGHLAKMLGVTFMTVKGWVSRNRISKEGAKKVGDHPTLGLKFKAKDLRPEIDFDSL